MTLTTTQQKQLKTTSTLSLEVYDMAGNIKGITIEFKGDTTQLGKALTSVNKQIRDTDSALREVDKALKLDPTNVDLLAQKEALLAKQIEQTKDKLDLQTQAAEAAADALAEGTVSQEEYAKLAAQVATTASKLDGLEESASGASDELTETGDAAEEAGESAEDSAASFEAWGEVAKVAAEGAAVAISAVAAAVAALVDATISTAGLADEVLTLSTVTGVSAETIQAMNYASELLDVSTDTMTGSMTKLLRTMSSAQDGTGDAAEAFAALGVDITDEAGNLRDNEDVFWDIIDALGEIDDATERDATAMSLLGRSAQELNPLIEAGSGAFEELRQEALETGYIMSDDTLDAFGALDDNMQRLNNGATAARNALGGILLPILTDLSNEGVSLLSDFTNALLDTDGDITQLGAVIDEMVPRVLEILNTYLPILIDLGVTIIETLASALIENLPTIIETGVELIMSIAQGIIDNLSNLAPTIVTLIVSLVQFLVDNLPTVIEAATQIIVAVVQGIAQAMPELIPAVVECVLTICEALIDNLPELILAAQELFFGIIEGLAEATPDILAAIPVLIVEILAAFGELAPQLVNNAMEWGMDFIASLVEGIQNAIPNLVSGVTSVADTIASYLHFSVPDKGPLADFDKSGADMIDEFITSMQGEEGALNNALYQTGNVILNGMTSPDYTGALSGISEQLAGLGGGPYVFNINIGGQRFATQVVNAIDSENYLGGGL